jgi:cation diffusion facilitator family transporter
MADDSSFPLTTRLALGSVGLAIVVLGMKGAAAWLTGSIALYSDALESVVNVATAIVALVAVRLAGRPASATLPYGYHKAEYFSAVIIGVFIAVAALVIFRQAYDGFVTEHRFSADPVGLVISLAATVLNAAWAWALIRYGRRERSKSLLADGKHLWTDVISTGAVLVGVMVAALSGYQKLDAILAALVGVTILWSGWEVVRDSVIGLMDVAVDPRKLARIKELISSSADGAIEAHDIRTRQAGKATFIEFHLVVPGSMSVEAAHQICDRIEAKLRDSLEDVMVTIHVEPEEKAKHSGIVVV